MGVSKQLRDILATSRIQEKLEKLNTQCHRLKGLRASGGEKVVHEGSKDRKEKDKTDEAPILRAVFQIFFEFFVPLW